MSAQPLLSLKSVSRTYKGADSPALANVDLDIMPGEFVAIVGPSGAGKSTLLNVLALLDVPDDGEYFIDGREITALSKRQRVTLRAMMFGFVFQASNAIESRSVAKNIEVPLVSNGTPFRERTLRIIRAMTRANIAHKAGARVSQLSGGERQRMAIARALVTKPDVLFLDEPTGNLDTANSDSVMALVTKLNRAGTTIILVTHDLQLAEAASRTIHVRDGRVSENSRVQTQPVSTAPVANLRPMARKRVLARLADDLGEATFSLWGNPVRSSVAAASMAVAVAGLIASVCLGASASRQVDDQLVSASQNQLRVAISTSEGPAFLDNDVSTISALDGVVHVGYEDLVSPADSSIHRFAGSVSGDEYKAGILGLSPGSWEIYAPQGVGDAGQMFALPVVADSVAVVGSAVADSLDLRGTPDQTIMVNSVSFNVIGIASDRELANTVIVSHAAVDAIGLSAQQSILVETDPGRASVVADAVPRALDPAGPGRFTVSGAGDLTNLRAGISESLQFLVSIVSIVLLLATMISVAAMMTGSVAQRQGEIGLRMATGASSGDIARMFMFEGAGLGVLGAVIGLATGVVAVLAVCWFQNWTPVLSTWALLGAFAGGLGSGVVSAILPSVRASRIQPAIAVRS